jgi:hypothetical protein
MRDLSNYGDPLNQPFPPREEALFSREWEKLQAEWRTFETAAQRSRWLTEMVTRAKDPDGKIMPAGDGLWGSLALCLEDNFACGEPPGTMFHEASFLEVRHRINLFEQEKWQPGDARPSDPDAKIVADFRLAEVEGYEIPWALLFKKDRGSAYRRADLRDWFLRERLALPIFWLKFDDLADEDKVHEERHCAT